MDVCELSLATVLVDSLVDVPLRHFCEGTEAELQRVCRTGMDIEQPLIQSRLVHEPGLAAHGGERRIIRMRRESHPSFLRHREYFVKKTPQTSPKFFRGN